MNKDFDFVIVISKYLYLADIIKIAIMLIEKTFSKSKKIKRIIIFI